MPPVPPQCLTLANVRPVNVFTGAVEPPSDIVIRDGMVASVAPCGRGLSDASGAVIDLGGRWACPGLIDGHVHIESTMLAPVEFARAVVPRGTTAVVADPHEVANVCGLDGIRYLLDASAGLPLTVFIALPSCVPASPFDEGGAVVDADLLATLVGNPRVVALGEVMDFRGVLAGSSDLLAKLDLARTAGLVIDGHCPGLRGPDLDVYLAAGVSSDHECSDPDEAREKLAKGMRLMIREGSAARNLQALLPVVTRETSRRCLLVTDDRHPDDLLAEGHLDHLVRQAVRGGLDPITAIQMATINVAEHFGLERGIFSDSGWTGRAGPVRLGAIAPGYRADIVILDDLAEFQVHQVYCGGILAARGGRLLSGAGVKTEVVETMVMTLFGFTDRIGNSFNVGPLGPEVFRVPAGEAKSAAAGDEMAVIDLIPGSIATRKARAVVPVRGGYREADPANDLVKLAVIERHRGSGQVGLGFMRGFGLHTGALATSVAHDAHNLIVVGIDDRDMAAAAQAVAEMGGGLAAARDGRVVDLLPLPYAGLMSDRPASEVAAGLSRLRALARSWGVREGHDPFMTLSFISLPVIPELRLTTRGLVYVARGEIIP